MAAHIPQGWSGAVDGAALEEAMGRRAFLSQLQKAAADDEDRRNRAATTPRQLLAVSEALLRLESTRRVGAGGESGQLLGAPATLLQRLSVEADADARARDALQGARARYERATNAAADAAEVEAAAAERERAAAVAAERGETCGATQQARCATKPSAAKDAKCFLLLRFSDERSTETTCVRPRRAPSKKLHAGRDVHVQRPQARLRVVA